MRDDIFEKKPGSIIGINKNGLEIVAGDDNIVVIRKLVPAGSKEMDALSFSNGYHIKIGDMFN